MKKRLFSLSIAVIMLIGLLIPVANAASSVPTELWWDEAGAIAFMKRKDTTTEVYLLNLYKNNQLIDRLIWDFDPDYIDEESDGDGYGVDFIEDYGSGNYTFKVGVCSDKFDENYDYDIENLHITAWSALSPVFAYTKPTASLAAPVLKSFENNRITYTYTNSDKISSLEYSLYIYWDEETKVLIGRSQCFKENMNGIIDIPQFYNNHFQSVVNIYHNSNSVKYNKNNAKLAACLRLRPKDIREITSSNYSPLYVSGTGTVGPTPEVLDRTVISDAYYDAAKVTYDLGIMPDVYKTYNKTVKKGELAVILTKLMNKTAQANSAKNTLNYSDSQAGTEMNGCINAMVSAGIMSPDSSNVFGVADELTYAQILKILVFATGYDIYAQQRGGYPTGYLTAASYCGISRGVTATANDKITYEMLSGLIYNTLETKLFKQVSFGASPSYDITNDKLMYGLGLSKYTVNANISGDTATVSGKVYNSANLTGTPVNNESLSIQDEDIKGYTGSNMALYVKDGAILSGIPYFSASFTINGGETTTSNKIVTISFDVFGYTKFKFGEGPYSKIPNGNVSYTLDGTSGAKPITITFANADESKTTTVTKYITLDNKRKITYMANGQIFETAYVDCGSPIPALLNTPTKENCTFDGWEGLPEVMPDKDITVTAAFSTETVLGSGACGENAVWTLYANNVLVISGSGDVTDYSGYKANEYRDKIQKVIIEEGIVNLCDSALYEIYNLEDVVISKTVKSIGNGFCKGSKVRNVIIPENVESINLNWAFIKCPYLESVYIMNKDIHITVSGNSGITIESGVNYYGYKGSEIETFAANNSCNFFAIDSESEILYGDVNNDGAVSAKDNAFLARHLANWSGYDESKINKAAADVNADSKITAKDNAVLARHLANWTGYDALPYLK